MQIAAPIFLVELIKEERVVALHVLLQAGLTETWEAVPSIMQHAQSFMS